MTQYVLWMLICFLITLVVVLAASKRLTIIPTNKFTNMVEYGYEFVKKDMGESAIGHGYKKHLPFLATLFFFILISNFVGLIPGCKTPTGSISITWALAAISFIYFIFWGIKAKGLGGYLKSFAPSGLPLVMVPIVWFLELFSTVLRGRRRGKHLHRVDAVPVRHVRSRGAGCVPAGLRVHHPQRGVHRSGHVRPLGRPRILSERGGRTRLRAATFGV